MSNLLKGNYNVPTPKKTDENNKSEIAPEQSLEEKFEAEALTKLGGSITFVKKKKSPFVWKGEEDKKDE